MSQDMTHYKKPKKDKSVFPYINVLIFILFCLFILVPIWKVLVDSLDASAGYGMSLLPRRFSFDGYKTVFTTKALIRPLLVSVLTTLCGTLLGLMLSTLGGYVLIQFDMPGRGFLFGPDDIDLTQFPAYVIQPVYHDMIHAQIRRQQEFVVPGHLDALDMRSEIPFRNGA